MINHEIMKIEIKISAHTEEMSQMQSQKIRRMAYILHEAGFDVDVIWGNGEEKKYTQGRDFKLVVKKAS